jgi:RIO kinase 1
MKAPESLATLIDYGIIEEVIRPLMSGKEAQVYVVRAGGEECVAKVYKEASQRTFKHRSDYTEGRRTRNTRDQRAMSKRSQHGRKQDEAAWRSTEVDMIYRLRDAGVRVPEPINFVDGVLVMELVRDADGDPAPRLGDLSYTAEEAEAIFQGLIREVVRMLCAGVIHGDLSEFNVLMSASGAVVIDFPQAVDPTQNPSGKKLLLRDVENLHRFLARFAPDTPKRSYAEEIWKLYQENKLTPDSQLRGQFVAPQGKTNTDEVMGLIADAGREERLRRAGPKTPDEQDDEFEVAAAAFAKPPTSFRKVVDFTAKPKAKPQSKARPQSKPNAKSKPKPKPRTRSKAKPKVEARAKAQVATKETTEAETASKPAARRRRGRKRAARRPGEPEKDTSKTSVQARSGAASTTDAGSERRPRRRRRRRPNKARSSE